MTKTYIDKQNVVDFVVKPLNEWADRIEAEPQILSQYTRSTFGGALNTAGEQTFPDDPSAVQFDVLGIVDLVAFNSVSAVHKRETGEPITYAQYVMLSMLKGAAPSFALVRDTMCEILVDGGAEKGPNTVIDWATEHGTHTEEVVGLFRAVADIIEGNHLGASIDPVGTVANPASAGAL